MAALTTPDGMQGRFRRGETEWHALWKQDFASVGARTEAVTARAGHAQRADITLPSGTVIEIQKRALPDGEAAQRELVYRRMLWILDGTALNGRFHLGQRFGDHAHGVWIKRAPKWWTSLKAVRFIDLGEAHDDQVAWVHHLERVSTGTSAQRCAALHLPEPDGTRTVGRIKLLSRFGFVDWAIKNL